jgi:hypothetical protein
MPLFSENWWYFLENLPSSLAIYLNKQFKKLLLPWTHCESSKLRWQIWRQEGFWREREEQIFLLRWWGVFISGHCTNYKRCVADRVKGFWEKKKSKAKLSMGKWKYPVSRCFHVGRNPSFRLSEVPVLLVVVGLKDTRRFPSDLRNSEQ